MISLDPTDFSSWRFVVTRDASHMAGALSQAHCGQTGLDQWPPPTLPMTGELLQLLPEVKPPVKLQT